MSWPIVEENYRLLVLCKEQYEIPEMIGKIERNQNMGASGWIYYVSYQESIEKAFQELRQHVFETDQYAHNQWQLGEEVVDIYGEDIDISSMQECVEQEDGSLLPVPPSRLLKSTNPIEELVKMCGPAGTHSILDINRLITDSRYYGDVPLKEDIIQDILKGAKPTKAIVEAVVFQEKVWQQLNGCFEAERMQKASYGSKAFGIFRLSEEVLEFFALENTKEEIAERLIAREDIWINIHRCLCFVINTLAMSSRAGTAMPISSEELFRIFGKEKVSRAEFEEAYERGEARLNRPRGMGSYAVLYQNDVPHEIVFEGFSGD